MPEDANKPGLSRTIGSIGPAACERLNGEELRSSFLIEDLFTRGELRLVHLEMDRLIVGGVVPVGAIMLGKASQGYGEALLERREMGVINLGESGRVQVGERAFRMEVGDCLYIGMGESNISFESEDAGDAAFYFVSCPAHMRYATALARKADAKVISLGSTLNAAARAIYQYIHPGGLKSSQLMMGITELEPGSVWNTMPAHTHDRRSEVYLYDGLLDGNLVVHLMGRPEQTRSLIVRNREAVLSPSWSIHTGAGTSSYRFVWAMAGENQDFTDFAALPLAALL